MMEWLSNNQVKVVFCIFLVIGALTHYVKKHLRGETDTTVYEWFGTDDAARSIVTISFLTIVAFGTVYLGLIDETVNFWVSMFFGFAAGFATDSLLNGDSTSKRTYELKRGLKVEAPAFIETAWTWIDVELGKLKEKIEERVTWAEVKKLEADVVEGADWLETEAKVVFHDAEEWVEAEIAPTPAPVLTNEVTTKVIWRKKQGI